MYGHLMRHPGRGYKGAMIRPAAFPTAVVAAAGGVRLGALKEDSLLARFSGALGLKVGLPAMERVVAVHGPAPTAGNAESAAPPAVVEPTRGEEEDAAMALLGMSLGPAMATLEPAKVHTQLTLVTGAVEENQISGLELLAAMATAAPEVEKPTATEPEPVRGDAPVVVREKRRLVSPAAKKPKMRRLDDLVHKPPNPAPAPEAMEVEPPSPVSDQKKFACPTCGLVLPTYQALGGHVSSHSKVSKFSVGQQLDNRLAAAHAFQFPNTMAQHQQRQGGVVVLRVGVVGVQNIPPPLPEPRNRMQHPCTRCTMVFPTGQALGGHMRVHWTAERQQVDAREAMSAVAAALATVRRPVARRPLDFDLNELPME